MKLLPARYPRVLLVVTCYYQRVYEFLSGSFHIKVSVFLLKPAANRLHPRCKGMGEILRASNFTLAVSSQHSTLNAATSFNQGMQGASQQEEMGSWFNWDIQRCGLN